MLGPLGSFTRRRGQRVCAMTAFLSVLLSFMPPCLGDLYAFK